MDKPTTNRARVLATPPVRSAVDMRLWLFVFAVYSLSLSPARADATAPASQRLQKIFEEDWERVLRENPVYASELGDLRYNDQWPDVSIEATQARKQAYQSVVDQLTALESENLSEAERLNLRLLKLKRQQDIDRLDSRWFLLPVDQRDGIQDASSVADSLRFDTAQDYRDWIARLSAFPVYLDQTIDLMRTGAAEGRVHPRLILQRVVKQIERQIVDDPASSLFYKPFRSMPQTLPADQREQLQAAARTAIAEHVTPAFRKFKTFFEEEYLPACLERVGVWQLPQGRETYAMFVERYTTTDMTPEEIHNVGLAEVARIKQEMLKVQQQAGFEGTFEEFLEYLRTSPEFYFDNANDLLAAYREVKSRVTPELDRFFKHLPSVDFRVEPIPANIAPDTTTAYYMQPSGDGRRPGTYYVNLYRPEVRPKFEIEVLSLHESQPGHHLQIALAMELDDMPLFRRYTMYTAFVEGWGLYSESLGDEMGIYDDPYSKFGQLTYEMWRAVRLVVDTGMHHYGWTRQQAIDYFAENTAKSLHDITNEIDRYATWPGQALAYKIGELKIQELRRRAEATLGDRFDIRDFHDVVLRNGALPLDELEQQVDAWLAEETEAKP